MRRVLAAAAAFAVAAIVSVVDVWADERAADARPTAHYLLFNGLDLWRSGGFAHGGVLWSPGGLEREGFTLKLLLGDGKYRYRSGTTGVTGTGLLAAALPGWRFRSDNWRVTVYAGLDLQHHRLRPDDPGNRLRGAHAGLRVGTDLWWEPSAATMASASMSLSSIGWTYWTRGAFGWRLLERCYVGPELHAMGGDSYWQYRVGAHVTAFKTGALEWSAGVGFVSDSDERSGVNGRLGVLTRR